jgi:DNA-binding transcriptional regulator YiaG
MDVQVFAPAELASEAKRLLAPFEVNSIISPMRAIDQKQLRADRFLIYLSGQENEEQLTRPLKRFAVARHRLQTVVLYARRADNRLVVLWARAAQRTLPDRTEFCFSATDVARALNLRPRTRPVPGRSRSAVRIDIEPLRTTLGLTQSQLAVAIGVSERTVQNWEAGRVPSQAERRLRDLTELNEAIERYIPLDQRQAWLISPNDAFAGDAPRDWIIGGRARDLLWEFRRMQVGEPV